MPSIKPSHAGPAPIAARKAGRIAVAVSWLQSLKRLVRPTPRTVRFSQDLFCESSAMKKRVYSRVFLMQRKLCCGWKKNRTISQPRKPVGKIRLFLGGAIQNYPHIFECYQTTFHHLVQPRKNCLYA